MHQNPNLAQLSTPRRAQARPGAHSGRIVALGPAVSQLQYRSPLRAPRLPSSPAARSACRTPAPRAPRDCTPVPPVRARLLLPAAPRAMPHASARAPCRPARLSAPPARLAPAPHARPAQRPCACLRAQHLLYRGLAGHCIAIQSSLAHPSSHNTIFFFCIAIHVPHQPFSLLQYSFSLYFYNTNHCIATQNSPNLQYNLPATYCLQ